jgi:excinuclease ABC subunit A
LASGAIKGWDRRNGFYFSMLESLAKHYAFDVEASFESLPDNVRHVILWGSGEEDIKFSYIVESGASQGKRVSKKHPFEGIIPNHHATLQRNRFELWCAKTWRACAVTMLALIAMAPACAAKRDMCAWARAIKPAPFTK